MGVINSNPEGYLDLLNSKTDGRNPRDASDTVAPTVDIGAFYRQRNISHAFGTALTSDFGDGVEIEVPAKETWLLFTYEVSWTPIAIGNSLRFNAQVLRLPDAPSPLSGAGFFTTDEMTAVAANEFMIRSFMLHEPLVLPSGVLIRTTVINSNNITRPLAVNLGIYRFTS